MGYSYFSATPTNVMEITGRMSLQCPKIDRNSIFAKEKAKFWSGIQLLPCKKSQLNQAL